MFNVSVFAPEIGTTFPVSEKRLDAQKKQAEEVCKHNHFSHSIAKKIQYPFQVFHIILPCHLPLVKKVMKLGLAHLAMRWALAKESHVRKNDSKKYESFIGDGVKFIRKPIEWAFSVITQ